MTEINILYYIISKIHTNTLNQSKTPHYNGGKQIFVHLKNCIFMYVKA